MGLYIELFSLAFRKLTKRINPSINMVGCLRALVDLEELLYDLDIWLAILDRR